MPAAEAGAGSVAGGAGGEARGASGAGAKAGTLGGVGDEAREAVRAGGDGAGGAGDDARGGGRVSFVDANGAGAADAGSSAAGVGASGVGSASGEGESGAGASVAWAGASVAWAGASVAWAGGGAGRREPGELVAASRAGDRAATARLISLIERGGDLARQVARLTFATGGDAYSVGITGAPGAGKSTLTDRLITEHRRRGEPIGVLAVDPSSPFSGGALLGDRVRMQDHTLDEGVFIRSMASRGHLGGLALATPDAIGVLAAAGIGRVLVETVGVGQVEIEVAGATDTTVVVVNPGWGDAIQANKAGLLEVADVFVVNKADRPGAEETRRDLEHMLELGSARAPGAWCPPIVLMVATTGEGVTALWDALEGHRGFLTASGQLVARRERRLSGQLREVLIRRLEHDIDTLEGGQAYREVRQHVIDRVTDPYSGAELLLAQLPAR